jgi:hypothetical protein
LFVSGNAAPRKINDAKGKMRMMYKRRGIDGQT